MRWPLLRVLLLYAGGVLLGDYVAAGWQPEPAAPLMLPGLFGTGFLCFGLAMAFGFRARQERLRLICLGTGIFVAGWANDAVRTTVISPHDLRVLIGNEPRLAEVRGVLIETPFLRVFEAGEKEVWRTLARVEISAVRLDGGGTWQRAVGRMAVATPGVLTNLFGGQEVEISGVAAAPKGPVAKGMFDYRQLLRRQGIYYRLQADEARDWKVLRSPERKPLPDRFREWAKQVLGRGLPGEDESLRLEWALTLGWRTGLTEAATEPFVQAATYHIFAVDGLRMAIVFGIWFGLLRVCGLPRRVSGLMVMPLIWFYVGLTGWPASAIRAAVMLSVIVGGWVLKRPSELLNSLFAAALIILVWDPQEIFQAGFQLSFVVVFCLIVLLPMVRGERKERGRDGTLVKGERREGVLLSSLSRWFGTDPLLPESLRWKWPGWVSGSARFMRDLFWTSLVAWVGSLPLVAYYFNIVTPVSTPANIAAVPLCGLVLMSNLGSLLLAPWLGTGSELFNHAGWFFMECIRKSSVWFAGWPRAWLYVPAPGLFTCVLYYGLLLGLASGWLLRRRDGTSASQEQHDGTSLPCLRRNGKWLRYLVWLAVVVWCALEVREWGATRLTVLPVQGGLVTWVDENWRARDLLVDTGNTNGVEFVTKPFLRAQGVNVVQALGLSHGDLHHVGGAGVLAENFKVKGVYASGLRFRSSAYRRLLSGFESKPGLVTRVNRGQNLSGWEVLHPAAEDRFSRADDGALVLRRTIRGTRVLLLSDLGRAGQEALMSRTADLRADIVVTGLPSSASGEAICEALLEAIRPQLVIVGDSEYPVSERAGERLKKRLDGGKFRVIYTRSAGAVTVEFRDGKWDVRGG
jgi:competence protein ComEC